MLADSAVRTRPEPGRLTPSGRAAKKSDVRALAVVVVVWTLMLISVQPWSHSDVGSGTKSASVGKGVLVVACIVLALAAANGPVRGRIPATWWFYFVYAATAAASALLVGGIFSVGTRAGRIAAAFLVPLVLWPLIARRPSRLITAMTVGYAVLAASVLAGIVLRPGSTWQGGRHFSAGGRLVGAFLPMLAPRVGEVGAVLVGLAILGWAFRRMSTWLAVGLVLAGALLVLLSRTRTAPASTLVGLIVCVLIVRSSDGGRRLRNLLLGVAAVGAVLSPIIISWALRNQSAGQLSSLSGRTVAWDYILHLRVDLVHRFLGHGLGNTKIFIRRGDNTLNYAAIDNSWLSLYYESGLVGVGLVAGAFIAAVVSAVRAPTPYIRAASLFLLGYLAVAGFNETGLSDVSTQTLMIMVAAVTAHLDRRNAQSTPPAGRSRPRPGRRARARGGPVRARQPVR